MEGPRGTRHHPISAKCMQNKGPRMAAYQQVPRNEGMTGFTRLSHAAADSIPPRQSNEKKSAEVI